MPETKSDKPTLTELETRFSSDYKGSMAVSLEIGGKVFEYADAGRPFNRQDFNGLFGLLDSTEQVREEILDREKAASGELSDRVGRAEDEEEIYRAGLQARQVADRSRLEAASSLQLANTLSRELWPILSTARILVPNKEVKDDLLYHLSSDLGRTGGRGEMDISPIHHDVANQIGELLLTKAEVGEALKDSLQKIGARIRPLNSVAGFKAVVGETSLVFIYDSESATKMTANNNQIDIANDGVEKIAA